MKKLLVICLATVILSSCGLMERTKKVKLPPLPQVNEEVDIDKLWSTSVGTDKKNLFPGLMPSISADVVYAASPKGKVVAINATSGKKLWSFSHNKTTLSGGPGAGDGIAVVGDHDGMVYAHGGDGKLLWSVRLSSEILSAPAIGYGQVIVRAADGQLFGLSMENGTTLWAQSIPLPALTIRGNSSPVIVENTVVTGFDNGNMTIIDMDSGGMLLEHPFASGGGETELERIADIDGTPLVVGDNIALASYQNKVSFINTVSGRIIWDYSASTNNSLDADEKHLYVVDEEGVITALDIKTGEPKWFQEALRNQFLSGAVVVGDYIACGDSKGNVHWLATDDGRLVGRNKLSGAITAAPLGYSDDVIVVHTRSGTIAALRVEALDKP